MVIFCSIWEPWSNWALVDKALGVSTRRPRLRFWFCRWLALCREASGPSHEYLRFFMDEMRELNEVSAVPSSFDSLFCFDTFSFSSYDSFLHCRAHVDEGVEGSLFLELSSEFLEQSVWRTLGPQAFWVNAIFATGIFEQGMWKTRVLGRWKLCLWKETLRLMYLKVGRCGSLIKLDSRLMSHIQWRKGEAALMDALQ